MGLVRFDGVAGVDGWDSSGEVAFRAGLRCSSAMRRVAMFTVSSADAGAFGIDSSREASRCIAGSRDR